jgi:hypothetical protein
MDLSEKAWRFIGLKEMFFWGGEGKREAVNSFILTPLVDVLDRGVEWYSIVSLWYISSGKVIDI